MLKLDSFRIHLNLNPFRSWINLGKKKRFFKTPNPFQAEIQSAHFPFPFSFIFFPRGPLHPDLFSLPRPGPTPFSRVWSPPAAQEPYPVCLSGNPTRLTPALVLESSSNRVPVQTKENLPLSDFFPNLTYVILFRDRIERISLRLRFDAKIPIYRSPWKSNFRESWSKPWLGIELGCVDHGAPPWALFMSPPPPWSNRSCPFHHVRSILD